MNEPRRFLDDDAASPEVRRLLAAAEPPGALDPARLARSRRRVVALASLPMVGGSLVLVQKLALGALLGSVVGVGLEVGRRTLAPAPPAASVVVPRPQASAVPKAPRPSVALHPAPELPVAEPSAVGPMPSVVPPTFAAPPPVSPPSPSAGVTRELELLEAARRLVDSDPARALGLLEQHATESPRGTLVIERELLVIQALVRAGRLAEAKARAARFRAAHPESLYEERITRILAP
ncbi:MAG TPA: hypothetical protein VFV94_18010 [Polyangiaceae bacterium]|nr:hypothetical protein [Polyangiaceae bacterium]